MNNSVPRQSNGIGYWLVNFEEVEAKESESTIKSAHPPGLSVNELVQRNHIIQIIFDISYI